MPTIDQAVAAADAAIDAVFGETIEIQPKGSLPGADPNARRSADATRPVFDTFGVFNSAGDARRAEGRGISNTNLHHVSATRSTIVISRSVPLPIRQGDHARLVGRDPVVNLEVVEVHRHEGTTVVLEVVEK